MIRPAIVIIGYNREVAMKRLLYSIEHADYPEGEITLIISVDKAKDGSSEPVTRLADSFMWEHGRKLVIQRPENFGLKKHVLTCGDLSDTYGSVILLEDDLYVSPSFYFFASAALEFSKNIDRIGGISLYNHQLNVHVREMFSAIPDPYDNWYFQFASSWGQTFLASQWNGFREWLKDHDNEPLQGERVPENVSSWSDKSWLKYYIKYLIDTDKYFLYPSVSYTTNFSDAGEHALEIVNDLQVPLSGRRKEGMRFRFAEPDETRSVYDAFFENIRLRAAAAQMARCEEGDITIDLYGYRRDRVNTRYLLSPHPLHYKCVRSFARRLRPHDENIFMALAGNDLFLYDRDTKGHRPYCERAAKLLYDYRAIKVKEMLRIIAFRLKQHF